MTAINPPDRPFANTPALRWMVQQVEEESGGKVYVAARDLQSGDVFEYNADVRVKTASTIKFPMLVYVAQEVDAGRLSWEEKLTLTDMEKVGGSGVLTQLTEGLQMSLKDVCTLMTIVSDNTATNMIIERLGVAAMNERFNALNMPGTRIFRKSYSDDTEEGRPFGLGSTRASEMASLMARLANNELAGAPVCESLVKMMEAQNYRDCIPRFLPESWTYAGKTGSIDGVRNDVGLVTVDDGRRFALAVFTQEIKDLSWTSDNLGLITCANLARVLLMGHSGGRVGE